MSKARQMKSSEQLADEFYADLDVDLLREVGRSYLDLIPCALKKGSGDITGVLIDEQLIVVKKNQLILMYIVTKELLEVVDRLVNGETRSVRLNFSVKEGTRAHDVAAGKYHG